MPQRDPHLPTSSYPYPGVVTLVPAVVMPLLVATSRLYRGEHHPTDLMGGVVEAALWLTATYLAIRNRTGVTGPARRRQW